MEDQTRERTAQHYRDQALIGQLLEALEAAYMLALQMPHDALRIRSQAELCAMRNAIAAATGREAEEVQNDFEARAAIAAAKGEK